MYLIIQFRVLSLIYKIFYLAQFFAPKFDHKTKVHPLTNSKIALPNLN